MKRRSFLKHTLSIAATGALWGTFTSLPVTRSRPNVLIIHTDEHRFDCLGAYGNKQIKTPHIDSLAADGVLYNNSYCSYPVCTPSRYSLITGVTVREHGGYSNHCTLRPGTATFPAMLKESGYKTKAVGKMHYTPTYFDVGFEEMELAEQNGPGRWDDDYHRYLRDHDLIDFNDLEDQVREYRKRAPQSYYDSFGARVSNLPDEHHSTTWIGDCAVEAIEKWSDEQPNFLMAAFIKPHHPFDPPKKWAELYSVDKIDILPGWTDSCFAHDLARNRGYFPHEKLNKTALKKITAYYYATISHIDYHVGRMIEALKKKNMYDDTMIIFTSDHGEYLGYHHMLLKGNYMYEPLGKVPLIIKYPESRDSGQIKEELVSNLDLAPTILRAAGLKPAPGMTGLNLAEAHQPREVIICENRRNLVMARNSRWKLIMNINDEKEGLLFDLHNDPYELKNLYNHSEHAGAQTLLTEAIISWLNKTPAHDVYVDETASQIKQPNVPPDVRHRKKMIDYYRKKMDALQSDTSGASRHKGRKS